MRFLVGGVVIGLWAWATGRFAGLRMERSEWRPLVFLGLLFTLQIGSMNVGTSLTSAAHSAILLNRYAVHTVEGEEVQEDRGVRRAREGGGDGKSTRRKSSHPSR